MKRYVIQVYMSKEQKKMIDIEAIKNDKSVSDFCKEILLNSIKKGDDKNYDIT